MGGRFPLDQTESPRLMGCGGRPVNAGAMNTVNSVEAMSLTCRYGERVALRDVSFTVGAGELVGVLGPNGGGKSTLFRILTTLLSPSGGTARIAGADVVRERRKVRAALGIVFQHPSLDGKLTVRENLMHQGHLYGLRGATLRRRSAELLTAFELAPRIDERVDRLSGGLQRRVELAKAMLHRPRVLLLDEPSTGLDPGARRALLESLVQLKQSQGVTTLLTTHIMEEADGCDRVAVLHEGMLVAYDAPVNLKATIGGDVLTIVGANLRALCERIAMRFSLPAVVINGAIRIEHDKGHELVPSLMEAFPGEIESISVGKPTLDDLFIHLTGRRLEADGGNAHS